MRVPVAWRIRSGGGAQFLCVYPTIPHKSFHLKERPLLVAVLYLYSYSVMTSRKLSLSRSSGTTARLRKSRGFVTGEDRAECRGLPGTKSKMLVNPHLIVSVGVAQAQRAIRGDSSKSYMCNFSRRRKFIYGSPPRRLSHGRPWRGPSNYIRDVT